jgi:hypothetical protein
MVGALAEGWRTEDDLGPFLLPLLLLSVGASDGDGVLVVAPTNGHGS